ncbi:MAG: SUMF1/EgtB/PvdO family nonheme iron enzyme, partial [Lentisphaerae bacterium]|nr:SUMF1/EgtB/PvdO family nonheme iron enzyme [Lentisphaerota bacterium]
MIFHRIGGTILVIMTVASFAGAADDTGNSVRLTIVGAAPATVLQPLTTDVSRASYYFRSETDQTQQRAKPLAWHPSIYPGIDLISYGDDYQLEYVFTVSPGADPSLIKLAYEKPEHMHLSHTGNITVQMDGGEMIQMSPVIFLLENGKTRMIPGRYSINYDKTISIDPGTVFNQRYSKLNGTQMNLVPVGGQPGGPMYSFYVAKYEVTNDQFLRFLNNAEANRRSARGANMFFKHTGSIAFKQDDFTDASDMFNIAASRLVYNPKNSAGNRYDHARSPKGDAPFASHPVSGVSWYGAVKYCNWLTIESGRGLAQLCYTEGTNALDWAPVTATNWTEGVFEAYERELWLSYQGFRLPMVDSPPPLIITNAYNEFYKSAAWSGVTNMPYGFGREICDIYDANYRKLSIGMGFQTLPVGFFNGTNILNKIAVRPNNNYYGIYDLSGNMAEWMTDRGRANNRTSRAVCGGSWIQSMETLANARLAAPSA